MKPFVGYLTLTSLVIAFVAACLSSSYYFACVADSITDSSSLRKSWLCTATFVAGFLPILAFFGFCFGAGVSAENRTKPR